MGGYPASFTSTSIAVDNLVAGESQLISRKVTILSGQNLLRGAVLGKITLGAAAAAAKAGGNAANTGAFTLDVATPILAGAQVGVYTVRCIAAAANGGTFRVTAPNGAVLGDVAVAATFANQIKFSIADGAQDFVVGEGFDVTIAAGSGKYVASLAAAVDGSQVPDAVLVSVCDASLADAEGIAYFSGTFNESALVLGAGHTLASIREGLRAKDIHLVATSAI
ncbi:MAG: head decoration protein [Paludibaculum sp.]